MLSAKWTYASLLAVTALGAGSFAFAGCTVTSGTVNSGDGGPGNVTPGTDSGGSDGSASDAGTDGTVSNACPSNTKQKSILVSEACQAELDKTCCSELTTCFNLEAGTVDGGGAANLDCEGFAKCIEVCGSDADPNQCIELECIPVTSQQVVDAYDAITTCAANDPTAKGACGL